MPAKDPLVYVMHIRDSCRRIADYIAEGGATWVDNSMIMDAVCRQITIIGEAARKLEPEFHKSHPEIPWAGIIGARNIVMHAYESLKPQLIREMAERDAPALLAQSLAILGEAAD